MKHRSWVVVFAAFQICPGPAFAGQRTERAELTDSTAVARIIDEGTNHSQVMDLLSWLTDVCGPRLTGYRHAAAWTQSKFARWGLSNSHLEAWGPFGRGWALTRYCAQVTGPVAFPLISYPRAWSPGTDGRVRGEAILLDASTDSALQTYRGKLHGKFVLFNTERALKPHFEPQASRLPDSTLLQMANEDPELRPAMDFRFDFRQSQTLTNKKLNLCMDEGARALLFNSNGDGGTVFVQSATFPVDPELPWNKRPRVYAKNPSDLLPQAVVAAEHYNRILRTLQKGIPVTLEMDLAVDETEEDSVHNVIAELPGTDLKDEVVMIGGHLDSWHAGTGATDDGTGVVVCMEAMRILTALQLKPRRTIRIALWAGEEQGLLGSAAYVRRHFGERRAPNDTTGKPVRLTPEAEKFSVYFNHDNGTGKIRGIYLQGFEHLRPLFRTWFAPFRAMGASTITSGNTDGTDHLSFTDLGLPGFQFIQDEIEYDTRTHHSNMDVYDRAQEDDLKQASIIMAAFAYTAAMRDDKCPRALR
jgi:carboxypeptidase Q